MCGSDNSHETRHGASHGVGHASVHGPGGFRPRVRQRAARSGGGATPRAPTHHRGVLARAMRRAYGVPTPRLGDGREQSHLQFQATLQCQSYVVSLVHGRCFHSGATGLGCTRLWACGRHKPAVSPVGRATPCERGGGARLDGRVARDSCPHSSRTPAPAREMQIGSDPAPRTGYAGATTHGGLCELASPGKLPTGRCPRVLGAFVQVDRGHVAELQRSPGRRGQPAMRDKYCGESWGIGAKSSGCYT